MLVNSSDSPLLVIVTGLSGAGKSTAIKALEDLSFYCIDNLPFELVEAAVDHLLKSPWSPRRYAFGMDARDRRFLSDFPGFRERLKARLQVDVLFLSASDDQLAERYITTRRKHPMLDDGGELIAAIRRETVALKPIEDLADVAFDTGSWSPHGLARKIEERYSGENIGRLLHVTVVSFGFKHGLLKPADSIFDVRFLRNPHFEAALKEKTGLDPAVAGYVFKDELTLPFLSKLVDLHKFLFPEYFKEGKHYFRIGIGCTGGKHRSVAIAEKLAMELGACKIPHVAISVSHRDIDTGD